VDIRPLRTSDLDAALALNNDNLPALSELDGSELARLVSIASIPLAAELDDEFAGFCIVMPPGADYASVNYTWFRAHAEALGYPDFAYLDRIAVAAPARGHGVGRALYAHLVDALRGAVPVLFCEVNLRPRNDRSLAFHASIGFREVGRQDTDGGTKQVSLLALDLR
jgi:predicted GNAT superfamily acetyltransferase